MLGRAWREMLDEQSVPFLAPAHAEADLLRPETVAPFLDDRPALAVNCAAWTDVDGAEEHEDDARALNALAPSDLARLCKERRVPLVHYSTDYVFDGAASEPYPTDHPRAPIGAYARTKAMGEQLIEHSGAEHLIVRTSWLYAPWGRNFVRTMARLMGERDSLRVVDDQHGRPTSCEHLAHATLALAERGDRGVRHVTDAGQCTWHAFARAIADAIGSDCRIDPCTTEDFPRPAPRPRYSVLDLTETEHALGPMPRWQDNLTDVLARLERDEPAPAGSGRNT